MFKVDDNNISLIRGDTGSFNIQIVDSAGEEVTLNENDALTFTLRRSASHPSILLQKYIDVAALTLLIKPDDTAGLTFGKYVYDIQLRAADGSVDTIIPPHSFEVLEEVTY